MAENTANIITHYQLEIPAAHKEVLGHIRHWDNLKAAFDGDSLWIKNITPQQAENPLIKGLPYSRIYYAKDGVLFLKNSLLPIKKMPQSLLWSPLAYALPVVIPALNHNYFGISQKINIRLIPLQKEETVVAVLANKEAAGHYIQTAPKIRLAKLKWSGIDDKVLIIGTPLLPFKSRSYWLYSDILIPAGFGFELPVLAKKLKQKLDPNNKLVLLWNDDNTYTAIEKEAFMPLTISSFRLTYTAL